MKPTTIWFLGGIAWTAFLLLPLVVRGYFRVVPSELHLVLVVLAAAALMYLSRCRQCGLPVIWDDRTGIWRFLRSPAPLGLPRGKCARCGADI